jgi:hypothetical protein
MESPFQVVKLGKSNRLLTESVYLLPAFSGHFLIDECSSVNNLPPKIVFLNLGN